MLYLALLTISLTFINGILLPESARHVDSDINQHVEDKLAQGHTPLNYMFEEAEELMEDTQHQLEDAVHQVTNNTTGETHITKTPIQSSGKGNNINHECVTNEDCEKGKYCRYETHRSSCRTCKLLDVPCSKDEECCTGQLCVWGQCSQNTTKGEAGSTCQYQKECRHDLCCAFHKALRFAVCMAKPIERERCYGISNHLMELLSWDTEGESPREHCPCAGDLQCLHLGRGSMCLKEQNSSEEDLTDTLYSEIDYIV
ncbi:dickkopf-related protein 3a isoform X2 [Esox lucius]|uniref:dickkopf-related protein 3a isoform X2 n=1 Tax=Esox lucius TaxID=8010 RepID=UPI000576C826|nr:dickkopf-related protein 3a isoform X2 [Esox lucius]